MIFLSLRSRSGITFWNLGINQGSVLTENTVDLGLQLTWSAGVTNIGT